MNNIKNIFFFRNEKIDNILFFVICNHFEQFVFVPN